MLHAHLHIILIRGTSGQRAWELPTQCCFFGEKQLGPERMNNVQSAEMGWRENSCGLVSGVYFTLSLSNYRLGFDYAVESGKVVNELGWMWNLLPGVTENKHEILDLQDTNIPNKQQSSSTCIQCRQRQLYVNKFWVVFI
jgi:hypothetical protein